MTEAIPNPDNFCGGNFQDWLEVNLLKQCNATCSWCIEKAGWHPKEVASWDKIVAAALETGRENIILLGGEPTLYRHLHDVIHYLNTAKRKVWITTNGSMLTEDWTRENLYGIHGVNISLHHVSSFHNSMITGLKLDYKALSQSISALHDMDASVRLNCNCIALSVDSEDRIHKYIQFAKDLGADGVRFAELKMDDDYFIDLAKILDYKYDLNDDPFTLGCHKEAVIDGMPVNFRQMCGLQTPLRPKPVNPKQATKQVLYYDGKIYNGWQLKEDKMTKGEIKKLMDKVAQGKITPEDAADLLKGEMEDSYDNGKSAGSGGGCVY